MGSGYEITSARKRDKGTVTVAHGGCGYRLTLETQMAHDSGLCVSSSSGIQTLASGARVTSLVGYPTQAMMISPLWTKGIH